MGDDLFLYIPIFAVMVGCLHMQYFNVLSKSGRN